MIKQFNFYDIYGYLIPGMLLLGILWMPVGITMQSIPEQDLSKALFLGVLAYIVGHLLRVVSSAVVPSTVKDNQKRQRIVSELLVDSSDSRWSKAEKLALEKRVQQVFGIPLAVDKESNGADEASKARNAAFFQARSYLIAKKAAAYAEQFEGLYAMMRGLGCSLCVGVFYFLGWCGSSYLNGACTKWTLGLLTLLGVCGTVWLAQLQVLTPIQKKVAACLWLVFFLSLGFAAGKCSTAHFGHILHPNAKRLLILGVVAMILAARLCFTAYRSFAKNFAETVWRDFSACVAYGGAAPSAKAAPDDE